MNCRECGAHWPILNGVPSYDSGKYFGEVPQETMQELVAAAETVDVGEPAIEVEDIQGQWARPSFDLATESIGVFEGDRLVASADVFKGRRAETAVHPDHRGRGVGSWLAGWVGERVQAMRQYLLCERLLRETFDAVPEPATRELYDRLRLYPAGVLDEV